MEGYLGQGLRPRSWVRGRGHKVKNVPLDVPLTSDGLVYEPAKEETGRNTIGGVFKALCGFITPHIPDVTGVIVLTSCVCLCVCLLPLWWSKGQTYRLEFCYGGQVEGYQGQGRRSRSKANVNRSKYVFIVISIMCPLAQNVMYHGCGCGIRRGMFQSVCIFMTIFSFDWF